MEITEFKKEYNFLSNFSSCELDYNGHHYHNTEAAYQAQKFEGDEKEIEKFTRVKNPLMAKRMGSRKSIKLPDDWDSKSIHHMRAILQIKFSQPQFADKLKATGDAFLAEGNHWHDNKWGICTCEKCRDKEHQNLLGKMLMEIRDNLPDADIMD